MPVKANKDKTAYVNEYFAGNPEMVLGEHSMTGTMYGGKEEYTLLPFKDTSLKDSSRRQDPTAPGGYRRRGRGGNRIGPAADPLRGRGNQGRAPRRERMERSMPTKEGILSPIFGAGAQSRRRQEVYRGPGGPEGSHHQGAFRGLHGKGDRGQRKRLNRIYDAFVAKHGVIFLGKQVAQGRRRVFAHASLESTTKKNPKAGRLGVPKGPPSSPRRTISLSKSPNPPTAPEDAIKISLTYRSKIDLPYVAKLLNAGRKRSGKIIIKNRLAYLNPPRGSSNPRTNTFPGTCARNSPGPRGAVKDNHLYDNNVEDLKKIQPES